MIFKKKQGLKGENMVIESITEAIAGRGMLEARIRLPPAQDLRRRPDVVFDLVRDKRVLHIGCTDHIEIIALKIQQQNLLHQQLSGIASVCLGVDIDVEAAEYLRARGIENIIIADITQPGISQITESRWDYLLLAEILEHVDDPVLFLKAIATNYREHINGVIITVPNAFGLIHMSTALNEGVEALNRDHRYWFTPYTLCKVAHHAGLSPDKITMCANEYAAPFMEQHRETLQDKPLLLDTVVLEAHWAQD
jgi:2-polyprenyl-3-methyl-5-hydroxy-6-metoxy-1,4-benzoquinol methylase